MTTQNGLRECCRDESNRETVESRITTSGILTTQRCTVCARRHYIAEAAPLRLSVEGEGD